MQLEVILNGNPTQLIGSFIMRPDRRLAARVEELEELGIKPRDTAKPNNLVALDDLSGLSYVYEESTQQVCISAPPSLLVSRDYDMSHHPRPTVPVQSGYGAVLNYDLFGSGGNDQNVHWLTFSGATATFDSRLFTPFGTFSQGVILQSTLDERFAALRLNSTFAYSDTETMVTYRAGDTINGGLAWTRPVRVGGLQVERNFGLRPDLVTLPLPSARGSAAVPSTADIYINNVKTMSQDIAAGPYVLSNLPAISGNGTARVVLRDSSGHATESVLPFYVSANFLAPGLFDYSLEAGMPRLSYGTTGDTYVTKPVASASTRYGVFDWLTVEGHAEGGAGLVNASGGVAVRTGSFGVATVAGAASHLGRGTGFQSYLAYETRFGPFSISASSQMTFGSYDDLASVTARLQPGALVGNPFDTTSINDITNAISNPLFTSARPPEALNRITIGAPVPCFSRASLAASYVQTIQTTGLRSDIVSATLSTTWGEANIFASAFTTVAGERNTGFMAGVSFPLGTSASVATSASGGTAGAHVNVDAVRPLGATPGSYGWRVRDTELGSPQRAASVSYRSSYGRIEVGAGQAGGQAQGTAEIEGAIATLGSGVFFTNRIDDAFAVVETGVQDVEVFYQNRPAGFTDSSGRILIPGLLSYQTNKIAIDTTKLPVDADVTASETVVAPADRSGVKVDFTVKTDARPAVVVFQGGNGQPLAAGVQGQIQGGESFTVGYDGRAYIKNLAATNEATITLDEGQCHASFAYEPRPDEQVVISPVLCR